MRRASCTGHLPLPLLGSPDTPAGAARRNEKSMELIDIFPPYKKWREKTSVADPDPGSGAFLTPGSGALLTPGFGVFLTPGPGWVKNQDPDPG